MKKKYLLLIPVILALTIFFLIPLPFFSDPTCTLIEDRNGELLGARIADDGQWRFPPCTSLSDKYIKALIAFEDKRFYQHHGIDPIAIARALKQNVKDHKISQGGSTISMQIVRLMRKNHKRTLKEKIIEAIIAFRLEITHSKAEILALYASNAPFGSNIVGIDAAAWRYFGRKADELSWAEAATLAVLPNNPSLIHPGRNREALTRKRNRLLDILTRNGTIDVETHDLALLEPIPEKPLPLPQHAPHLLDRVAAKQNGTRTTTTLSLTLQKSVAAIAQNHAQNFRSNKVHNAAVLVADIHTRQVLAYIGNLAGDSGEDHSTSVDLITSPRSTGSILKPFLFAAMLDCGEMLPGTLLADIPLHISGFSPNNHSKTFSGAVPASQALERSLNVPAVRMLNQYDTRKFHALLKELGMTTLTKPPMHYGLSLILGGAEATLWDVASMYANMAATVNNFGRNSGKYDLLDRRKLTFLDEKQPASDKSKLLASNTLSAAAIYQTLSVLAELNRPEEESSWKIFSSGRKISWKTGTSYGNRDAWAVGVTPDHLVAVWIGNATGEGRPLLTGVGYAAPLMFDVFNLLPHSSHWFPQPYDEMLRVPVCRKSGHRTNEHCPEADTIWIVATAAESAQCPYHISIHLDKDEQFRVNSDCYSPSEMHTLPWFVLPPAQEWYYKALNADYHPLPPLDPRCTSDKNQPMQLIYPVHGLTIVLTKQIDGQLGQLVFQAAHNRPDAVIFWHIDDEYIGQTRQNHQIANAPSQGSHRITLIDDAGNTLTSTITLK
ncbi:MAG: penicillin-binding protein 1C [Prevotellaceae bacterium]|jgi:penicillin-binding protein 1C|nr:penicillin-binding protein 1C [Prevotellaceae bacterium]